jgi:threonine dehydratase
MKRDDLPLDRQLRQEILFARERVYRFGKATPLERLNLPGPGPEIWVKREDLSAVKSYKWRGACNRMAMLTRAEAARGVVTASAGNHAQGVALAARVLSIHARIYMPRSTPKVKQNAVRHHGGGFVEIHLSGDSYDEAVSAARADEAASGAVYVHAYDDIKVMAGQGTLADEIVLSGHGPFDAAYLQIGGGGLAAGVSSWLTTYWPDIEIVGVDVLCGANIDFLQLGLIAQSVGMGNKTSRTLRVRIPERAGTMLELLDTCFDGLDIADFQYGKTDALEAWPAFTIHADDPAVLDALPAKLDAHGFAWEDLTGAVDIAFRAIPLRGDLLKNTAFLRLDFYERPGALHDFLDRRIRGNASLCYFNYRQSGERIGRALIGLDFPSPYERDALLMTIPRHGEGYRLCEAVDEATRKRLLRLPQAPVRRL